MDGGSGAGGAVGRMYCYRCGHFWRPRTDRLPRTCPRCGSSRWNDPVARQAVCRFCGTGWRMDSVTDPCPECGRTIFESPDARICHCTRCDHEWRQRSEDRPERCPLCRSTLWDAPRPRRNACRLCGHVWIGGEEKPRRCPRCKTMMWDRPVIRVQCRVCGHRWAIKGGKSTGDVRRCPSCRSSRWMEPPAVARCGTCGLSYVPGTGSRRCPRCSGTSGIVSRSCGLCGAEWSSAEGAPLACPVCGRPSANGDDIFMELWSGGGARLSYALVDGSASVYLWEAGVPVSAMYFHDVCAFLGTTSRGFSDALNDGTLDLAALAAAMGERRGDRSDLEGYFEKRLGVSPEDAEVLRLHFTGMCPEAIALFLGRDLRDVRSAFDRIMAAYDDCGIAVDDTVFTDDPLRYYRCRRRSDRAHSTATLRAASADPAPATTRASPSPMPVRRRISAENPGSLSSTFQSGAMTILPLRMVHAVHPSPPRRRALFLRAVPFPTLSPLSLTTVPQVQLPMT